MPSVGDPGHAALGLIAENLSLFRNDAPEKRKQRLAPLCNIVAPELAFEFDFASAQMPPCSLFIRVGSAPVKISCQRSPSLTIRTTLRVLRGVCEIWAEADGSANVE